MKCRICSSEFTPTKKTSKYCSMPCAQQRHYVQPELCRNKLHRMTPDNRKYKRTNPTTGRKYYTCRLCAIGRDRKYRTGEPWIENQLEWRGPKKPTKNRVRRGLATAQTTHGSSAPSPELRRSLQMVADGYTTHAAAMLLGLDQKTFSNRLYHARRRLGVGTTEQAVLRALVRGWITPDRRYTRRRRASCRTYVVRRFANELRGMLAEGVEDRLRVVHRPPLAALGAESLSHAVSLLYAHGLITRFDLPPDGWAHPYPASHKRRRAA